MMSRALLVITCVALTTACRPAADAREQRDFERMRQQQRYDSYERSAFFANGATMQAPPAHTIARDPTFAARGQTLPAAYFSGRVDSAYAARIPLVDDDAFRALGARQFSISCAPCHGAGGFGGGPIAPNLVEKRPPSLRSPAITGLPSGMIFSAITNGFGRMPPYGWQMAPATRWAIVAYLRTLATQPMTAEMRTDSARALSLQRLDSLRAAGASLQELLRQPSVP